MWQVTHVRRSVMRMLVLVAGGGRRIAQPAPISPKNIAPCGRVRAEVPAAFRDLVVVIAAVAASVVAGDTDAALAAVYGIWSRDDRQFRVDAQLGIKLLL
jgi:hypothetical protein